MIKEILHSITYIIILFILFSNPLLDLFFPNDEYYFDENIYFKKYPILNNMLISSDSFAIKLYNDSIIRSTRYNIFNNIAFIPDGYTNGTVIDGESIKIVYHIPLYILSLIVFVIILINSVCIISYPIFKKIIKSMFKKS